MLQYIIVIYYSEDSFHVGLDINITLEMRPRSADGVLLSIYGKQRDYLIIQLVNGEVSFSYYFIID